MEGLCQNCRRRRPPLFNAASKGHIKCLEVLMKEGTDVNMISKVFTAAIDNQWFESAEFLLETGINLSYNSDSALKSVVKAGHYGLTEKFIKAGASVNVVDGHGRGALHNSTTKDCTELLIREGADVNLPDRSGFTPLHCVAERGNVDSALSLLSAGADVNRISKDGITILMQAASSGKVQLVETLLEKKTKINAFDSNGRYALHRASGCGHAEAVKLLLKAGADVNAIDSRRKQHSLIAAAVEGHEECLRILLGAGADVNATDHDESSALMSAAQEGHDKCVTLLLEAGADVNYSRSNLDTALHSAAHGGSASCIDLLLKAGSDLNAIGWHNENAFMIAAATNHVDCVKLLLKAGTEVGLICDLGFNTLLLCIADNVCTVNTEFIALLHAAGERKDRPNDTIIQKIYGYATRHNEDMDRKELRKFVLQHLSDDDPSLCLKHACRRAIREHLLRMSRVNLFFRVPQLGLPRSLVRYLLYGVSLDSP